MHLIFFWNSSQEPTLIQSSNGIKYSGSDITQITHLKALLGLPF
jgi:hypothetical protein